MFQKDYKEYMNMIKPDASLVEAMVEEQKNRAGKTSAKVWRVAAALFCGILLLCGGTVAVDAATDGAIQRLLGIKDSIGVGESNAEFILIEPTEEQPYGGRLETKVNEDGTVTSVITSTDDAPVFSCYFDVKEENWSFALACSLKDCETEEEFSEKVYKQFAQTFKDFEFDENRAKFVIENLEQIKQEIGTETAMQDGCAMGVQLAIDHLKAGKDVVPVKEKELEAEIVTAVIKELEEAPVFSCYFNMNDGNRSFDISCSLKYCNTQEEIAWKVYVYLTRALKQCRTNNPLRKEVIGKLELVKQEIGTGTDLQDGSAMGVQLMIDDLTANTGRKRVMEHAIMDTNDTDGDGDVYEVLAYSFFNFDFDAMELETEKTGNTEFIVEAIAGIPGKYRVRVESYEPALMYYLERME
ncbi:MAG: hypothetical protein IKL28_10650 [Lachnospiraceae bacterium]|nr:hypothetical protein [Lachnospiraceae bacterium]